MAIFCRKKTDRRSCIGSAQPNPDLSGEDSYTPVKQSFLPRRQSILVLGLMISCSHQVSGEQFDFDLVTLPTDLRADIVKIEDDIALENRRQPNRNGSAKISEASETPESESNAQAETATAITTGKKSSGSIFSEAEPEVLVASETTPAQSVTKADTTVILNDSQEKGSSSIFSDAGSDVALIEKAPESEAVAEIETSVVASSSIASESNAEETLVVEPAEDEPESEVVETAASAEEATAPEIKIASAETATEAKVNPDDIYQTAVTEIPSQPEVAIASVGSTEQEIQSGVAPSDVEQTAETGPVLMVAQPVSAGDAAEMPVSPDEKQGLIVLQEEASDSASAVSPTVSITEAEEEPKVALVTKSEPSVSDATEVALNEEATVEPTSEPVAAAAQAEADQIDTSPIPETQTAVTADVSQEEPDLETLLAQEPTLPVVTAEQEDSINEDEIIIAWATAWSNNQTEEYLAFYADAFQPSDPSLDRAGWEKKRRKRLQNKNIRIIVSNAEVYRVEGDIVEVRFTQRYTSSSYKDRVIKSIEMTQTDKGWQFLSETTVEELPFE